MKKFLPALLIFFSTILYAQTSGLPSIGVVSAYPNASTTGTTLNTLTKLTGAPSTAVIAATTDTSGVIGVAVQNAGTSGVVSIQTSGLVYLVFDGATVSGDYVQISTTVAGNGHDAGSTCPGSGQVVGRILSTNASGGTYLINLGANGCGGSGGGGTSVNVNGSSVSNPNFNGTTPAAGTNSRLINWQVVGSSVSGQITGDGNAAHFLDGTGAFSTPSASSYNNIVESLSTDTTPAIINSRCSPPQVYWVTRPVTMTASGTVNCQVYFQTGAVWSGTSSPVVTFVQPVTGTTSKHFDSTITVVFASNNSGARSIQILAPLEWWGGLGDASTDNCNMFAAAVAAKPRQVFIGQGDYNSSCAISITNSGVGIAGMGMQLGSIGSYIHITTASADGIDVTGTNLGTQIWGNTFNDFAIQHNVAGTGTSAGISVSYGGRTNIKRVTSQDFVRDYYFKTFDQGVLEDSVADWGGAYGSVNVYGIYIDGASKPESAHFRSNITDCTFIGGTPTSYGVYATTSTTSDIISDQFGSWQSVQGCSYGIVEDASGSGSQGYHATDIHWDNSIMDDIQVTGIKTIGLSLPANNCATFTGGWLESAVQANINYSVDIESSSCVQVSDMQISTAGGLGVPQLIYINGSNNIDFSHNSVAPTNTNGLILANNSSLLLIQNNLLSGTGANVSKVISGTTLTNSNISGNSITGNGSNIAISLDSASNSGNKAMDNNFSNVATTVSDASNTAQWNDSTHMNLPGVALTVGSCSGCSAIGGTVTYTSGHTLSSSDASKLVVMNCSSACVLTFPATQPSTTFAAYIVSIGSTTATVALSGDTFNGGASVPVLNAYEVLPVWANSAVSTDYLGKSPLVAGSGTSFTAAANGLSISASGSGACPGQDADTFFDIPGTSLGSHTSNCGHTWTQYAAVSANTAHLAGAGPVYSDNASASTAYYNSLTPSSADYWVWVSCEVTNSQGSIFICGALGRLSTGAATYYAAFNDNATCRLYKNVAGTLTTLGTTTGCGWNNGETHVMGLHMVGTSISAWLDGVNFSGVVTDSAIAGPGNAGVSVAGSGRGYLNYFEVK